MGPSLDPAEIAEIAGEPIAIDDGDNGLARAAQANLRTFSLNAARAATLKPTDVLRPLDAIVAARDRERGARCGTDHPMLFSCRFDEQAA